MEIKFEGNIHGLDTSETQDFKKSIIETLKEKCPNLTSPVTVHLRNEKPNEPSRVILGTITDGNGQPVLHMTYQISRREFSFAQISGKM